jgi:DnaD/phage-associated family protein
MSFKGFTDHETFIPVPDSFFATLLNQIDDVDELKVTLYLLWRISHIEGQWHAVCRSDILEDALFMDGMDAERLDGGLARAVERGSLLQVEGSGEHWYLLNSPRGRSAAQALARGDLLGTPRSADLPPAAKPNIFRLYEENIGPLTPLMADVLRDAEQTYPEDWILDAMTEAVKRNKRNWKYVEAILKRWKVDGRHEGKDRQDAGQNLKRYTQSAFSEYLDRD